MHQLTLPEKYKKCYYCTYIESDDRSESYYCDNCFSQREETTPNSPICREFELDVHKVLPETVINDLVKSKVYLTEVGE